MIFAVFFGRLGKYGQFWTPKHRKVSMESNKNTQNTLEKDILFSQSIKAGQRIYYIDVKKNRRDEMYVSITESKKVTTTSPDMATSSFEKHKIFIFPEDFQKFSEGFRQALEFISGKQGEAEPRKDESGEIKIDLDF